MRKRNEALISFDPTQFLVSLTIAGVGFKVLGLFIMLCILSATFSIAVGLHFLGKAMNR